MDEREDYADGDSPPPGDWWPTRHEVNQFAFATAVVGLVSVFLLWLCLVYAG